MPSFKDVLAQDVDLFLNPDEFADTHTIDGRPVRAVIDENSDNQHPLVYAEGVSLVRKVLFVAPSELGFRPREGMELKVDGALYEVSRCSDEDGVYAIVLEANRD